jgi:5-(carboxyamino)imidazole ribonucleotide mutase
MMPPGIPVAAVGINTAKNAALLAIEILAVTDEVLAEKLARDRAENHEKILQKNQAIEEKYNS